MKLLNKKILIVSYLYPPTVGGGGVMRVVKFSKYLQQLGWQVHVLTAKRHDVYMADESLLSDVEKINIYESRDLLREFVGFFKKFQNSKKNNVINEANDKKSFLGKIKNILYDIICIPEETVSWIRPAVKKGIDIVNRENIDLVFSTSPPFSDHMIGLKIKEKTNVPLVIDYRDRWIGNDFFNAETKIREKMNHKIERKISENADYIITTTDGQKKHFLDSYNVSNIKTIYNGYDENDFKNESKSVDNEKITIAHLGRLTGGRTVKYLADALKELDENTLRKIKVRFYGLIDEDNRVHLDDIKIKDSVEICGMVKHSEAINVMLNSDCLLSLQYADEDGFNAIPAKVFEYMRSGTLILSLSPENSAIWNLTEDENLGINCQSENIESIKEALRKVINLCEQKENKQTNIKESMKKFERKELAKELDVLLIDLIKN